jgi:RNA polymerase sigma factor (sigma-70 family)
MMEGVAVGPRFDDEFPALFLRAMRLAHRVLGDRAAAEDVAADALAITLARWHRVAPLAHREAWVLRVTGNLALRAAKRRTRDLGRSIQERHPDRFEDDADVRVALAGALDRLPRRQREVVVLRYLGGFSEAEVAALTGVSRGTVKTHLHRGLANLRGRLGTGFEEVDLALDG